MGPMNGRRSASSGNVDTSGQSDHGIQQNSKKSTDSAKFSDFVGKGSPISSSSTSQNDIALYRSSSDEIVNPIDTKSKTSKTVIQETPLLKKKKEPLVKWMDLPRKDQLCILVVARLSEPLTQTSLGSYVYYQLQSFNPNLPDSTISYQAGIINAAFPAAQCLTAILWGRFADSDLGGRKRVIWIGLFGTMISMLGYGFAKNFPIAVLFRVIGGLLNGNVGVMRTMISEIIKNKKYQSKAFTLLPICFNLGVIVGPILGGVLADPEKSYPSLFGPGSPVGGQNGVQWMKTWPYALPNIVNAIFLSLSFIMVVLFLEETGENLRDKPDRGLWLGRWFRRHVFGHNAEKGYSKLAPEEAQDVELQDSPNMSPQDSVEEPLSRPKLPFRRIFTRNLLLTLLSHGLLSMHVGTFNSMWYTYLSMPRYDPAHPKPAHFRPHGFFHFTGGLALPPPRIGLAGAILGVIGITLQLSVYSRLSHHLGTLRSYVIFLMLFPVAYLLIPFLSLVPSNTTPPGSVSGPRIWMAITSVLFVQVLARTFALPCSTILVNNCCPHPSVLGTAHGIGQSVSSFARTFGPILFGFIFGVGLDIGMVGLAWWILAVLGVIGNIAARFLYEGDGHEIHLEGDPET